MARKRLTQIFPFLIPIRTWQKNIIWNLSMKFDKFDYATKQGELLPYEICNSKTNMINENSGYDIIYQKNKVENLKIISKSVHQILIYPNQIFSFCYATRKSKKYGKMKEGLILIDGKIVPKKGGGVCHISNLLYYLFLMSPLTIIERHGHREKSFPNPDPKSLDGIDATVNSGWLDLKVKNNTNYTYQIIIEFDKNYMYGKILCDEESKVDYEIMNGDFQYFKKNEKTYEQVSVIRRMIDKQTKKIISEQKLYDEIVEICYKLPKDVSIEER